MKSSITNNLEKDLQETLVREFTSSHNLRKRLVEMLEKDIENIHGEMRKDEYMDNPNWPMTQASKIGETKAIKKLLNLLK